MKIFIKIISFVLVLVCLVGIVYSSYNIYVWYKDTNKNEEIKEITNKILDINNDGTYKNGFETLKEKNGNTVGVIKVKGTEIDYVVVKGNDNTYYLTHDFDNNYSIAGWVFMDFRNTFEDKNIVIYGHNMRNGSMFGTLKNVFTDKWQMDVSNHNIEFLTEEGKRIYKVFSTYIIEPEDYYITTNFNSDDEYLEFLNKIKSRSNYDYKTDVNSDDKIITLSTCSNDRKRRVVLHAKMVNSTNS